MASSDTTTGSYSTFTASLYPWPSLHTSSYVGFTDGSPLTYPHSVDATPSIDEKTFWIPQKHPPASTISFMPASSDVRRTCSLRDSDRGRIRGPHP